MQDLARVQERIRAIFVEKLNLDPPEADVDLLAIGLLDSLLFLSLFLHLEESFGVKIELEKLDFEDFKSVDRIARLVVAAESRDDGWLSEGVCPLTDQDLPEVVALNARLYPSGSGDPSSGTRLI
jgi:acyl carrier protein